MSADRQVLVMNIAIRTSQLVQQTLIKGRLAVVNTLKWVIIHTTSNPSDIDGKYEKVFLVAKKINCLWHNNIFRHNLDCHKILPILNIEDENERMHALKSIYYVENEQTINVNDKKRILILASGHAVRWEKSHLKQLAPVYGKPIIEHILDRAPAATVVTRHYRLMKYPHIIPSQRNFVLETLLSTHSVWAERTIVLLGDTIYSQQDMKKVMDFKGDFAVFGSKSQVEIFALSFTRKMHAELIKHLVIALHDAYTGGRGKLWEMYHSYAGMPLFRVGVGKDFIDLKGSTDVDTIKDYKILLESKNFKRAS
jgi:hypothetical protein